MEYLSRGNCKSCFFAEKHLFNCCSTTGTLLFIQTQYKLVDFHRPGKERLTLSNACLTAHLNRELPGF